MLIHVWIDFCNQHDDDDIGKKYFFKLEYHVFVSIHLSVVKRLMVLMCSFILVFKKIVGKHKAHAQRDSV